MRTILLLFLLALSAVAGDLNSTRIGGSLTLVPNLGTGSAQRAVLSVSSAGMISISDGTTSVVLGIGTSGHLTSYGGFATQTDFHIYNTTGTSSPASIFLYPGTSTTNFVKLRPHGSVTGVNHLWIMGGGSIATVNGNIGSASADSLTFSGDTILTGSGGTIYANGVALGTGGGGGSSTGTANTLIAGGSINQPTILSGGTMSHAAGATTLSNAQDSLTSFGVSNTSTGTNAIAALQLTNNAGTGGLYFGSANLPSTYEAYRGRLALYEITSGVSLVSGADFHFYSGGILTANRVAHLSSTGGLSLGTANQVTAGAGELIATTGTFSGTVTIGGLTLAGGSATLTGILVGGTARNTVLQSVTTTGSGSQLGYVQVGTIAALSGAGSFLYLPVTSTGTPNLYSSGYYGFSGNASSPFHGMGFFTTNLNGILFRHSNTSFGWGGYNSSAGYSYSVMRSDGRIGFASGTDGSNGGDTMLGRSSAGVFWIGGGTPSALTGGLIAANGTLGSLSVGTGGLVITPQALATAASVTWDFSKASSIVTGSSAMTIALGTAGLTTAGQKSEFIIIGSSAGSTLTWSGALNEPQLYVGTATPVTTLGSGQRLKINGTSQGTGTPGLILERGP